MHHPLPNSLSLPSSLTLHPPSPPFSSPSSLPPRHLRLVASRRLALAALVTSSPSLPKCGSPRRIAGADDRRRGRGREVLAALARAVGPGLVTGTAIRNAGRRPRTCSGRRRARQRQLVADRLGRPHLPHHRVRRRTAAVAARLPPLRRRQLWETSAPEGRATSRASEERPRVGDARHRRPARLRLVRQPRAVRVRHGRQDRCGTAISADRQLSRRRRLAAALQGPRHPLSGSVERGSFIAAFDSAHRQADVADARASTVGWGTPIAVRVGDHDEIIVNGQNACRPTTRTPAPSCGAAAA